MFRLKRKKKRPPSTADMFYYGRRVTARMREDVYRDYRRELERALDDPAVWRVQKYLVATGIAKIVALWFGFGLLVRFLFLFDYWISLGIAALPLALLVWRNPRQFFWHDEFQKRASVVYIASLERRLLQEEERERERKRRAAEAQQSARQAVGDGEAG